MHFCNIPRLQLLYNYQSQTWTTEHIYNDTTGDLNLFEVRITLYCILEIEITMLHGITLF